MQTTEHSAFNDSIEDDRVLAYTRLAMAYDDAVGHTLTVNGEDLEIKAANVDKRPTREEYVYVLENCNVIRITSFPPVSGKNTYVLTYEHIANTPTGTGYMRDGQRPLRTLGIDGDEYEINAEPEVQAAPDDGDQGTLAQYA